MISERTRQALVDLITEEARKRVIKNREVRGDYNLLLQKTAIWKSKHYELLALLLDISVASVKRLFGRPGHKTPKALSQSVEVKILDFLRIGSSTELRNLLDNYSGLQMQNDVDKKIKEIKRDLKEMVEIIKVLGKKHENICSQFEQISS